MKRTDGLVQCKCREWRTPEDLCNDGTCVYCEYAEPEEVEPSLDDLERHEFEGAWDLENLADGYVDPDDDEEGHDW